MSDLMSKIAEDEEEYLYLCAFYKEPIMRTQHGRVDIYGLHARTLRERHAQPQMMVIQCGRCGGTGKRFNNALQAVTWCSKCKSKGWLGLPT